MPYQSLSGNTVSKAFHTSPTQRQSQAALPGQFARRLVTMKDQASQQPLEREEKSKCLPLNIESLRINPQNDAHNLEKWMHEEGGV